MIDKPCGVMVNKGSMREPLIKPFKGLLYNCEKIGDVSTCVCPPYDVISEPSVYYGRSPYNAIRLELPLGGEGIDPYEAAKKTLDTWLAQKVLAFDGQPSVYVYEQEFALNGAIHRRTGLIPLVRLDNRRILTHEQTRKKAREDRERLIERLKTFTSLIFAMYEDRSNDIKRLVDGAKKERLYDFVDEQSVRNRFFRMTEASEMDLLAGLMEEKNLYIADGHHRLSVSMKLGLPYVAIYLTDMYAGGITILPYHRIVKLARTRGVKEILAALAPYFDVIDTPCEGREALYGLIDAISASPTLSFVLYAAQEKPAFYVLKQKQAIEFDPEAHEELRKLRVNIIHSGVLKHVLGIRDEEISFLNDPIEAIGSVDDSRHDYAVLVPATTVEEVKAIADNSLNMPPKSTYFHPKVLTGLVFHKYA
jgi:uncharacterized protein (DUF1015 family)